MFKTLATTSVAIAAASAQSYGAQPASQYGQYHQQYPQQQQFAQPQYSQYQYGHYAHFEKAPPLLDPSYYAEVLSTFKQCRVHKCKVLPRTYATDIEDSIATVGEYTSCVTGCAAKTMLKAAIDYKNALAHIYDVGYAQLVRTRRYLANDHFAGWKRILFPVKMLAMRDYKFVFPEKEGMTPPPETELEGHMVSVQAYLDRCTLKEHSDDDDDEVVAYPHPWSKFIKWKCSRRWVEYLELLRHNVGHLILAPQCQVLAPDGACDKEGVPNPRAAEFGGDICVAQKCNALGKTYDLPLPIVKPLTESRYWHESCPEDKMESTGDGEPFWIEYRRVPRSEIKFYSVTTGLPSLSAPDNFVELVASQDPDSLKCTYDQGLADKEGDFFKPKPANPTNEQTRAAKLCPYGGMFEYCNMQQYTSYLQKQLFDNDACQLVDMHGKNNDDAAFYGTLACLYKVATLKCDCMEAVLNCYKRESHFKDAMTRTIGKAASILCGFVLCQRPKVYAFFGGQDAISGAVIMRDLLSQVGLSVPSASALPPATIAFLTFGLGMVSFFVGKKLYNKARTSSVSVEDGYRNLI